jgi:hypothetical protein
MTKEGIVELRSKILKGIDLAYQRLLNAKQKNDEYLVFSKKGKIIRIKARQLLK